MGRSPVNEAAPRATYRLQLHEGFPFPAAREIVPYLARLGVSHLYLSPVFASRAGSTHGYDVVDPGRLNPRLGGETEFLTLARAARARGLGIILDIVPNHMAADVANPYWTSALTHGRAGPAGRIFDIAWQRGKIRLPILTEPAQAAVAGGAIRLALDPMTALPALAMAGGYYPLRLETVASLILAAGFPIDTPAFAVPAAAFAGFLDALPPSAVAAVLEDQHYAPVHWRAAADTLTYRRFFTISDLVGVRVEEPAVFDLVHALPLRLLREGVIDGLRVDHIDGLADPTGYVARLRAAAGPEAPIYVEKILGAREELPAWPVSGTTGYEHLAAIGAVTINRQGFARLAAACRKCSIVRGAAGARVFSSKSAVARHALAGETERLVRGLGRIARTDAAGRDFGPVALRDGLVALLAGFPVYRAYANTFPPDPGDTALFNAAADSARVYADPWTAAAAGWIAKALLTAEATPLRRRFQQLTGPVMAKGYEDRELYRSVVLGAANEVGAELANPSLSPESFHAHAAAAATHHSLVPLATHDTKRGAGTRARLAALSHSADAWLATVRELERLAAPWRPVAGPDRADRWMLWQTAAATWPIEAGRLEDYARKCVREAARHGSWETPDTAYEAAVTDFCRRLIDAPEAQSCRAVLTAASERLASAGARLGMTQMILQLTLPGTADIYQGTELLDVSLVDPDNRRPVDFAAREVLLAQTPVFDLASPASRLHALSRLLALRGARPALFAAPWRAERAPAGWLAASRGAHGARLFIVVPLTPEGALPVGVAELGVPRGSTCVFTGQAVSAGARPTEEWPFVVAVRDNGA